MSNLDFGSYAFLTDYVHITFFVGFVLSYLFFRWKQLSLGGTLAVGYLASSLYAPLNVLVTLAAAFVGYALIQYVVLRFFLPRPRQIFAIGLAVGLLCGALWLSISTWVLKTDPGDGLSIVGIIVPGLICNSLVKQGVLRTMVPMVGLVPLSGGIGLLVTYLTSILLPLSFTNGIVDQEFTPLSMLFLMSSLSVILAVLIQEGTVRSKQLRTGGYVTAGIIISEIMEPMYLLIMAGAAIILLAVYVPYSHRVPLFGKDRFLILCTLSFAAVTAIELLVWSIWGAKFTGPQNIIFAVLPAIIVNDIVQYGWRKLTGGLGISLACCAAIGIPVMAWV